MDPPQGLSGVSHTNRNAHKEREEKKAALDRLKISNLRSAPTSDGKAGVFVELTNGGRAVREVILTICYLDAAGNLICRESIRTGPVPVGATLRSGFVKRVVPRAVRVVVKV